MYSACHCNPPPEHRASQNCCMFTPGNRCEITNNSSVFKGKHKKMCIDKPKRKWTGPLINKLLPIYSKEHCNLVKTKESQSLATT